MRLLVIKNLVVVIALVLVGLLFWTLKEIAVAEQQRLAAYQLELLKLRATAVYALVGFFAAAGLKFLFDEWREESSRELAKRSIARNLLAEVRDLRRHFVGANDKLGEFAALQSFRRTDPDFLADFDRTFVRPKTPVFESLIGSVGDLGQPISSSIIYVYLDLDFFDVLKQRHGFGALYAGKPKIDRLITKLQETFSRKLNELEQLDRELCEIASDEFESAEALKQRVFPDD